MPKQLELTHNFTYLSTHLGKVIAFKFFEDLSDMNRMALWWILGMDLLCFVCLAVLRQPPLEMHL